MYLLKSIIRKSQMSLFDWKPEKHEEQRTVHATTRHMQSGAVVQVQEHQRKTMVSMDTMVHEARRWKGAAMNADEDHGSDNKARLRHSRMTTKADLDSYLMRKFGIDESAARDVSNHLTQNNVTADRSAEPHEFAGEPWADAAIDKRRTEVADKPDHPVFDTYARAKQYVDNKKKVNRKYMQSGEYQKLYPHLKELYQKDRDTEKQQLAEYRRQGKYPDGRMVPKEGDKVFTAAAGMFGMSGSVQGEVYQAKSGLRVKVTKVNSMFGESVGKKDFALTPDWTVQNDPELAKRAKSREEAEQAAEAKRQQERQEWQSKQASEYHQAINRGELPVKANEVKEGDILNYYDGIGPGKKIEVRQMEEWNGGVYVTVSDPGPLDADGYYPGDFSTTLNLPDFDGGEMPRVTRDSKFQIPVMEVPKRKPKTKPEPRPEPEYRISKDDEPESGTKGRFLIHDKEMRPVEIPNEHGEIEANWPTLLEANRALNRHKQTDHTLKKTGVKGEYDAVSEQAKEIRQWAKQIKNAKDRDKKTDLYYQFLDSGHDPDDLVREMVLSLPPGGYKFHGREYGTNIVDEIFKTYGTMPSHHLKEAHLLGLTATRPEKIQATFTHDMDSITIHKSFAHPVALIKSKAKLTLTEEHDHNGHLIHRWKRNGIEHVEHVADKLAFIDHGEPVATMQGDEVPVFPKLKELATWAGNYWQDSFGGKATNQILGDVELSYKTANTSMAHGLNQVKAQAFYLVPQTIEKGVVLGELPKEANKPRAFIIGAPVQIGGQTFKMLVQVRRDPNMQRMYIHEVVLRKNSPAAFQYPAASPLKEAEPQVANNGAIYNLLQSLREGKMSKSSDAAWEVRIPFTNIKPTRHNDGLHLIKSRKLDGKINFNGLDISIETGRSRCREWKNPHDGTQGMSRMRIPYGFINKTMGVDNDAYDCFVGPDHSAPNVYIVTTMKAPDFSEVDEQKAFLGVNSPEEAKAHFMASYNDPRFFGSMAEMPFDEFKAKVLATKDSPTLL